MCKSFNIKHFNVKTSQGYTNNDAVFIFSSFYLEPLLVYSPTHKCQYKCAHESYITEQILSYITEQIRQTHSQNRTQIMQPDLCNKMVSSKEENQDARVS